MIRALVVVGAIAHAAAAEPTTLAMSAEFGVQYVHVNDLDKTPLSLAAQLGYLYEGNAFGIHADVARVVGHVSPLLDPRTFHFTQIPIDLAAYIQGEPIHRVWVQVFMGVHLDRYADEDVKAWDTGIGVGLFGGVDLLRLRGNKIGTFIGVVSELRGTSYSSLWLGLAYRR
jgi:hypothetical protein